MHSTHRRTATAAGSSVLLQEQRYAGADASQSAGLHSRLVLAALACACQIAKSPFKSLAEKVREFQAKTPVRFKTKPAKPAPSKQHPPITRAEVRNLNQLLSLAAGPCCCSFGC